MMIPTKEQFENAARFAGIEIIDWEFQFPIIGMEKDIEGIYVPVFWDADNPSTDTFKLWQKLEQWCADRDPMDAEWLKFQRVWPEFEVAKLDATENVFAEKVFLFAAAIGETMKEETK